MEVAVLACHTPTEGEGGTLLEHSRQRPPFVLGHGYDQNATALYLGQSKYNFRVHHAELPSFRIWREISRFLI